MREDKSVMLDLHDKLADAVDRLAMRKWPNNTVAFEDGVMIPPWQTDIERLQGYWTQTYLESDGEVLRPEDAICIFEQQELLVIASDGTLLLKGSFLVEDRVHPKAVTWSNTVGPDASKLVPSIYEIDGNTLTIVIAEEGQPRPTMFETGPGITLREFTRIPRSMLRQL